MKYFSLNSVSKAYNNFQNKLTNKSWGLLCVMKQLSNKIVPGNTYTFHSKKLSEYIESLFCLSDNNSTNNSTKDKLWYIKFSNQWYSFFSDQASNNKPNIFDAIAWAYRKEPMQDTITIDDLVKKFAEDFHIDPHLIPIVFDTTPTTLTYDQNLYSEAALKSEIFPDELPTTDNVTAEKKTASASVGELSRGPFIQPLYGALENSAYFLLSKVDFDKMYLFETKTDIRTCDTELSLQQIFYGAPGTGKSNSVKRQTGELLDNGEERDLSNVFRTTFHPDTDYASFVGCYKPTMESKEPIYTPAQLIDKLSTIKNSGVSYPCQKFGAKYWESLKELQANDIKQILSACGFTDSMSVEIPKGIAIGEEFASLNSNKQIVYRFVPQAFTDAYIYAYTHSTEQTYLVIEEINRGNCAQIFGDLFQLLDRKGGKSEYKIKADKDLANYLIGKLGEDSEGIKDGKLSLPANLNILATMNTSDQSLFPMDSAFKRRWEWEYVPINYGTGIKSGTFEITIGDKAYPWVGFIEQVNKRIFDLTQSEDKQLGNFFIKHSVDEKEFKSKVMFYLWYEVLRDETENNKYFFYKKTTIDDKEQTSKFIFKDLYEDDATQTLQQFMEYLGVAPIVRP